MVIFYSNYSLRHSERSEESRDSSVEDSLRMTKLYCARVRQELMSDVRGYLAYRHRDGVVLPQSADVRSNLKAELRASARR